MERISKAPDERKDEIVSTAQKLFLEKGYTKTKISDIAKAIGVSQGVFYYYYSSKKEIVDEIVDRYISLHLAEARKILENSMLTQLEKMKKMAEAQQIVNHRVNQSIHIIKGVDIHDKIINRLVTEYVPLMVEAFGSGQDEHTVFKFEIFVASANILFDPGIFSWTKEERNKRIDFMIDMMEQNLGLTAGSFLFFRGLMGYSE